MLLGFYSIWVFATKDAFLMSVEGEEGTAIVYFIDKMKETFKWYQRIDDEERKRIWEDAYLTVDTNVLLDLYRYHENTREKILKSFEFFDGRRWISNQAAKEFFNNRSRVVVSSLLEFEKNIEKMKSLKEYFINEISNIKKSRVIPEDFLSKFEENIDKEMDDAINRMENLYDSHPNYISSYDPILNSIFEYFNGNLGEGFGEEDVEIETKEAQRRVDEKIPPGYLDVDKDNGGYGDYFMWSQIIKKSKNIKKPMILVTSERKGDWWQSHSGRTVGPRSELLEEFYIKTEGQQILIYQTDNFLRLIAQDLGDTVDEKIILDIADVSELRESAVVKSVEQKAHSATDFENIGFLHVTVSKATKNFTASGRFSPALKEIPTLTAEFIRKPSECPRFKIRQGTGTNYDFNVHARAERGELLPPGEYVIKYSAVSSSIVEAEEDEARAEILKDVFVEADHLHP